MHFSPFKRALQCIFWCYIFQIFFPAAMAATTLPGLGLTRGNNISSILDNTHIVSTPSEPIFLQTKTAQGIAGTFVMAALFLTCQQVSSARMERF